MHVQLTINGEGHHDDVVSLSLPDTSAIEVVTDYTRPGLYAVYFPSRGLAFTRVTRLRCVS